MYLIIQEEKPIILRNKFEVLKTYLFLQIIRNRHVEDLSIIENDLDILCELYFTGGYSGEKEKKWFYKRLIDKGLRKSEQSISNKLTEFAEKGYIVRSSRNEVTLNYSFFPKEQLEEIKGLGLNLKVAHAS
jgi:hypothetical protein